ncbi:MAG: hypothetical protein ABIX37_00275, partial [Gammaproteobacteria bacterium]
KGSLVLQAHNRNVWRNLTGMFPYPYTDVDAENWFAITNNADPSIHLAIGLDGEAIGGISVIAGQGIAQHTGQYRPAAD